MRTLIFILASHILCSFGASYGQEVFCVGAKRFNRTIIFLHGIDSPLKSDYFANHLRQWDKLGRQMNTRIALPRSDMLCQSPRWKGHYCWNWKANKKALKSVVERIESLSERCFSGRKPSDTLWLGHSNGGYLVSRLWEQCLLPTTKALAIGSAGSPGPDFASTINSNCGLLNLWVGKNDITRRKTKQYYRSINKAKAAVKFSVYNGYHDVPFALVPAKLHSIFDR